MSRFLLIFPLLLLLTGLLSGQDPFTKRGSFGTAKTKIKVTPEVTSVELGDYFRVAFTLDLKPKYHAYYKNGGASGFPPSLTWELPTGFTAGDLQFPNPQVIHSAKGTVSYGYQGKVTFFAQIEATEELETGKEHTFKGKFSWLECDVHCEPRDENFSFTITVGDETEFIEDLEGFFTAAGKKMPQDGSAWGSLANETETDIQVEIFSPEGLDIRTPVYFFSTDQQVDSQAEQKVEIKDGKIFLNLIRNQGNADLAITAAEVKDSLSGLLVYQSDLGESSVELTAPLTSDAEVAATEGHLSSFIPATEADRKAGRELYDVNARPEAVLLGGAKEKKVTFFSSLGLVFLGGLILNLMPCVFPVLGLKVMGFVSQAGEDESKIKVHGMIFGLGLLIAMWVLAAIIISLKLDWGQQLANPYFLATMIIFFFLMGLNLYGVFEVGTSMTGVGGELQAKKGYSGSFFSGVLTTLVATPCSGPFLGAAMAFALAQPPVKAFVIFTVFGLGIASPYILLSFFPALIKKLPRPGAWMESFKQIMSFFVFATAVFFMKGYLKLVGDAHFNIFLFALLLIGLGAYIYGRWGTPMIAKTKRVATGYGLAAVLTLSGLTWAYSTSKPPKPGLAWNEWYPGVMERSRSKKRIVWVDYTADW